MLSEIRQAEKDKHHIISFIYVNIKTKTNEQNRNRVTDGEKAGTHHGDVRWGSARRR